MRLAFAFVGNDIDKSKVFIYTYTANPFMDYKKVCETLNGACELL